MLRLLPKRLALQFKRDINHDPRWLAAGVGVDYLNILVRRGQFDSNHLAYEEYSYWLIRKSIKRLEHKAVLALQLSTSAC